MTSRTWLRPAWLLGRRVGIVLLWVLLVAGIAVTDDTGRALPCEVMLGTLRDGLAAKAPTGAAATRVADLQARALERCNADDDRNADAFTAQALALVKG